MHIFMIAYMSAVMGYQQVPTDSSYLTFTLEKRITTVRLLHWSKKGKTAKELNRFVDEHLSEIDPNKIVIIGDPNAKYPDFKEIIEVMKKHDWMKFKLQKKDEKPKNLQRETL